MNNQKNTTSGSRNNDVKTIKSNLDESRLYFTEAKERIEKKFYEAFNEDDLDPVEDSSVINQEVFYPVQFGENNFIYNSKREFIIGVMRLDATSGYLLLADDLSDGKFLHLDGESHFLYNEIMNEQIERRYTSEGITTIIHKNKAFVNAIFDSSYESIPPFSYYIDYSKKKAKLCTTNSKFKPTKTRLTDLLITPNMDKGEKEYFDKLLRIKSFPGSGWYSMYDSVDKKIFEFELDPENRSERCGVKSVISFIYDDKNRLVSKYTFSV